MAAHNVINNQQQRAPRTRLLLIGIGYYLPGETVLNSQSNPIKAQFLRGAVADVEGVEDYARNHSKLGIADNDIIKLTSSIPVNGNNPREPKDKWPTYANIVKAFDTITNDTIKGDVIHIHFSCHGTRVKTSYPNYKGQDGVDEAIVPMDFRQTGKCLRDIELGILIRRMVVRGAYVSIFSDCCHSSSVTRGDDSDDEEEPEGGKGGAARAIEDLVYGDTKGIQGPNIPLPHNDETFDKALCELWASEAGLSFEDKREVWLENVGYESFAACHLDKKAHEALLDGKWHGLYTGKLLAALKNQKSPLTHNLLHRRVCALMKEYGRGQFPVFSGNSKRHFLRRTEHNATEPHSLSVINVNNGHLVLSEGLVQGVTVDSVYAVFPLWVTDFKDLTQSTVRVTTVDYDSAKAVWEGARAEDYRIEAGCQAVLVKYKHNKLRVSILHPENSTTMQSAQSFNNNHIDRDVLDIVDDRSADYFVDLENDQGFQLLDRMKQPVPGFPMSKCVREFQSFLSHLARYRLLRDLVNPSSGSYAMRDKFEITVKNAEEKWDKTHFWSNTAEIDVKPDDLSLTFKDKTKKSLYVTVFAFTARWGAQQIYPWPDGREYEICEKEGPRSKLCMKFPLSFEQDWPQGAECINYIKLFIVETPISFSSVHLQELGDTRGDGDENEQVDLGNVLGQIGIPSRGVGPNSAEGAVPWATLNIRTRMERPC